MELATAATDLRWVLLGIGALVVAGVYFYTRWYVKKTNQDREHHRKEPAFDNAYETSLVHETYDSSEINDNQDDVQQQLQGYDQVPDTITDVRPLDVEETLEVVDPTLEKDQNQKIVSIHVRARGERLFNGTDVLRLAMAQGLVRSGGNERGFFEYEFGQEKNALFYMTDIMRPGTFEWSSIATTKMSGLSFFARLPNKLSAPEVFMRMCHCADRFAKELGGVLQDDQYSAMTVQMQQYIEEELKAFESHCEKAGD